MAVKIRLTRIGKKKAPYYRIVAIDERSKRSGRALENLGSYDARAGVLVQLHQERIDFWKGRGAQETDAVKKLLSAHRSASRAL